MIPLIKDTLPCTLVEKKKRKKRKVQKRNFLDLAEQETRDVMPLKRLQDAFPHRCNVGN